MLVDLVVAPGLSRWTWKDEDENAQARRLGVVSEAEHRAVDRAREYVLATIEHDRRVVTCAARGYSLVPGHRRCPYCRDGRGDP
ncbi:hypothetical protein SBRY_50487 [Actinacidiphila bryophytorum]|uniref:DUF402 domain-containing protein n=1 Tax=Actinacidiphila bryophytorum TaxID=1436133 RepID=A0A9W4MJD5_9ACTN|nr:hypothetical protein SBRY_50487 [Actinacidiphila bryophytorum]